MSAAIVFRVGDKLPVSLSREQLAGVIGISVSRLDALRTQRSHPAIKELLPRVGHPKFSGATAQAWLDQQVVSDTPRFFGSARRRRRSHAAESAVAQPVSHFNSLGSGN